MPDALSQNQEQDKTAVFKTKSRSRLKGIASQKNNRLHKSILETSLDQDSRLENSNLVLSDSRYIRRKKAVSLRINYSRSGRLT